MEYQVDGGGWFPYREPVALPAGRHTVEYRAQGVNLFWSEPWSTSVQVDRVAPTAEATLTGRALVVTGRDADSGVARLEYRLDGGEWTTWTGPVPLDDRAHGVRYRAVDVAGNVGEVAVLRVPAIR